MSVAAEVSSNSATVAIAHVVLWAVFNATAQDTIHLKLFGIPIAFKVEQLRPLMERWVGAETPE
jgi:hypothetical protein